MSRDRIIASVAMVGSQDKHGDDASMQRIRGHERQLLFRVSSRRCQGNWAV
jgi:hypothetical protein